MKLPVHRIIPFSNVEGLGNRTSIFVQGCNANCLYCHNPETIPMNVDGIQRFTVDELVEVITSHMPYIRGITVSGGEATLYHGFLTELFERVHELGLTCYIDTNGFYNQEKLQDLIEVTDKFLFDIKGMDQSLNRLCFSDELLVNNHRVQGYDQRFARQHEHFDNLDALLEVGKVEEVRLVYVKNFYDSEKVIDRIAKSLMNYPEVPLKLIQMHTRGLPKERLIRLKGSIPSSGDFEHMISYASSCGIAQIIPIY